MWFFLKFGDILYSPYFISVCKDLQRISSFVTRMGLFFYCDIHPTVNTGSICWKGIWVPFYYHGLTLTPAWINNYPHYKAWDEITYPSPNVNGATLEFHLTLYSVCDHISMLGFKNQMCVSMDWPLSVWTRGRYLSRIGIPIIRPSYLYDGNPHTWKDGLNIETGPRQSALCPFSVSCSE